MIRIITIATFMALWFTNFALLSKIYDVTVYDQYIAFWKMRGILYDGMFFSIAFLLFLSWKGVEKALACFMVIITAGSVIDKAFLDITSYVYADFVLVFLGIIVSIIVYGSNRKRA